MKCSSCRASIEWVVTVAGKKMPLDLEPTPDGNIILTEAGQAQALGPIELAALAPGVVRRTSHFATCPDAAKFRQRPPGPARGKR